MDRSPAGHTISTILRHDDKRTSYKIALLRSINDVVLNYPGLATEGKDVAVPLLHLAEYWIAYYWPFVKPGAPIDQGQRSIDPRGGKKNDMAFRPELTALRKTFERHHSGAAGPHAGFFLTDAMRMARKRQTFREDLTDAFRRARRKVKRTLQMPIRYAGPGEWGVFAKPAQRYVLGNSVVALPNTNGNLSCLVVPNALWQSFRELSLWVEALCVHEWCLFTEHGVANDRQTRGDVFNLLTARPDSRIGTSWERNRIDILMMEGTAFVCPWTGKQLTATADYELDHVIPLAVYPVNELWNLVPADEHFNKHVKRDRIPSAPMLERARPRIAGTYDRYQMHHELSDALQDDLALRFATLDAGMPEFTAQAARAVTSLVDQIGIYRNVERLDR
jgi:5-methylcytosine-specific restriction endonuclease McrA